MKECSQSLGRTKPLSVLVFFKVISQEKDCHSYENISCLLKARQLVFSIDYVHSISEQKPRTMFLILLALIVQIVPIRGGEPPCPKLSPVNSLQCCNASMLVQIGNASAKILAIMGCRTGQGQGAGTTILAKTSSSTHTRRT